MQITFYRVLNTLLLIIMTGALFCQGCTRQEAPPYSGPPVKMSIGIYKGELTSIVYSAEQLGYFKQLGLAVELREFESGAAAVEALKKGSVDLATAADFVLASNIGTNPDLRAIAAINNAKNVHIVARRDRGIQSSADLRGKRIAVTLTTPGEYFLGKQLSYSRIQRDAVTMVNVTPTMMEKEMRDGNFDAAVVWNPVAHRIKTALGANAVSWNAQGESLFHMLLISRDGFITKEPAAMIRLMKALILAETAIARDPVKTRQYIAGRIGMPESYLAEVWGDYQFRVYLDRSLLLALEDESRWILKTKGLAEGGQPNYLTYLYLNALKAARPESVTIIH